MVNKEIAIDKIEYGRLVTSESGLCYMSRADADDIERELAKFEKLKIEYARLVEAYNELKNKPQQSEKNDDSNKYLTEAVKNVIKSAYEKNASQKKLQEVLTQGGFKGKMNIVSAYYNKVVCQDMTRREMSMEFKVKYFKSKGIDITEETINKYSMLKI